MPTDARKTDDAVVTMADVDARIRAVLTAMLPTSEQGSECQYTGPQTRRALATLPAPPAESVGQACAQPAAEAAGERVEAPNDWDVSCHLCGKEPCVCGKPVAPASTGAVPPMPLYQHQVPADGSGLVRRSDCARIHAAATALASRVEALTEENERLAKVAEQACTENARANAEWKRAETAEAALTEARDKALGEAEAVVQAIHPNELGERWDLRLSEALIRIRALRDAPAPQPEARGQQEPPVATWRVEHRGHPSGVTLIFGDAGEEGYWTGSDPGKALRALIPDGSDSAEFELHRATGGKR